MQNQLRRRARRMMEAAGVIGIYYRWRERRAINTPVEQVDDCLPMPPRELIMIVAGTNGQPSWFSAEGRRDAGRFQALASAHGIDFDKPNAVLDFGCGAGRIARWLAPKVIAAGGRFHGSDINPRLVRWCQANLDGEFSQNRLAPPLRFPDAAFDLVYGHSVLTHLREDTARAWLAELARVLKPGGLAILTFHDENYAERWGPPEARAGLEGADYVVVNNALEGSNYMSAWTTRAHFAEIAGHAFEVAQIEPGGLDHPRQATAVLRKP